MPLTNWPPTTYPTWPPVECNTTRLECSDVKTLINELTSMGFIRANPTAQETQTWFKGVRCDEDHVCAGIIVVSPLGVRYPFAYCVGATHKQLLVLWGPDYCMGGGSALE
jgi:hypothetical protein